ncbi:MAG TPA: hypothetical protein VI007_10160 [bacterium]
MSFLQRLRGLIRTRPVTADAHALAFYVRCNRCGEVIHIRADRRWDLLQELGEGVTGYSLHKDVLGTRCNALMHMLVRFDGNYKITHQEVDGGRFVSQAEYESERPSDPDRPGAN